MLNIPYFCVDMKYVLFLLLFVFCYTNVGIRGYAQPKGDQPLAWQVYAPVEYMKNNNLHYVKTYFFNANTDSQTPEDVYKLKQMHDSLAPITIGKVFMSKKQMTQSADSSTWYWWSVKEKDKAYIQAYIPSSYAVSRAAESYYKITFKDGSTYKWEEPRESPYNYQNIFILVDGTMQAMDADNNELYNVTANSELREKFLSTSVYYITKYNGYPAADGDSSVIEYEPVLQFVFNDSEAVQLKETLQVMLSNLMANN